MTKTERLLNLLQILRMHRYPVRGQHLADRLNINLRTLYRDIASLKAQGAEIIGESGVGYVLKPSFFLPPLMFSEIEMEALLLGIQWVSQYGDQPLARASLQALTKIQEMLPAKIKNEMNAFTLRVGPPVKKRLTQENLDVLRKAIREKKKIHFQYQSNSGKSTQRIAWPFTIGYFSDKRILVAWCEQSNDYRHFNTLGITKINILEESYSISRNELFYEWQSQQISGKEKSRILIDNEKSG